MYEVVEEMIDYIYENEITPDYLMKIGIPFPIVMGRPMEDINGISIVIPLNEYLDEIAERMELFIDSQLRLREEKTIADIRLSSLLGKFDLPICPFWLTFCVMVKCYYNEEVFT